MSDHDHDTPQDGPSPRDDPGGLPMQETPAKGAEYAIGELARAFRTTLRTLRFYEDKGLLHPRRVGMQRIYSQQDHDRLKLIVIGKKVGLSLDEIADMLEVYQLPKAGTEQLNAARESMIGHIDILRQRNADIDQALGELYRTVDVVTGMLHAKQQDRQKA